MNDSIRISGLAGFRIIWLGQIISVLAQQMFGQQVWVEDRSDLGFPFGQGLGCFMLGEGAHKIVFHPGGNDPGASCLLCLLPETGQGAAFRLTARFESLSRNRAVSLSLLLLQNAGTLRALAPRMARVHPRDARPVGAARCHPDS